VRPGTYSEPVCIPVTAPPILLYGTNPDPSQTIIVFDNIAGLSVPVAGPNPCVVPGATASGLGTDGSVTLAVYAADFQAMNLTVSNDADESTVSPSQAVALQSRGDKVVFENVRFLGNQDTVLVKTSSTGAIARAYFKNCYVEGDMDFICSRGTAVFDGGEVRFMTSRRTTGNVVAPSTDARNPYGLLLTNVDLTAPDAQPGTVTLGRAWDESRVNLATYATNVATGTYPNGQALVRDSTLGAQIVLAAPWTSAATTSRPYSSVAGTYPGNRMYEYQNSGPGAAP
jgi:pectinesterase